jgi:collagenase-like PrtC family protease
MPTMHRVTLTLGPLLFNWAADQWVDFYARIADEAPVDRVCLGEVVCSKRLPFYIDRIPQAIERLQRAGKTVILSSLALVTLKRERQMCADLALTDVGVEVNDLTMLAHLGPGRPFAVSPLINVYNESTLAFLTNHGANHICFPPELPFEPLARLAKAAAELGAVPEVWAFGRVPLAISGRCYHARIRGLTKDNCQFVCGEDPDGLKTETLDGEQFLAINGVQTLSFRHFNLIGDLDRLRRAGVTSFRLSPHSCDMVPIARLFRQVLDLEIEGRAASDQLARLNPGGTFSNGFLTGPFGASFNLSV